MISGNFGIFVGLTSVKFFPLTIVSMVMNCAPLISICLVGTVLGEVATLAQAVSILLAMVGVGFMMFGGSQKETRPLYTPSLVNYFMLLIMPLCISVSTLATRKARKLGESVVAGYMAFSLFLFSLLIAIFDG